MMLSDYKQKIAQSIQHLDKVFGIDKKIVKGVQISLCIIFFGIIGMLLLSMMKKAPVEVKKEKLVLHVEVIKAEKKNYPVFLSAYGEAEPVKMVPVAPEVDGKIIKIHQRLEDGEVIQKGELLFKVDPGNYELIIKSGKERLVILQRSKEISGNEFQRVKTLYEQNRIGTISGVEAAEKAWLTAADLENNVKQVVETAMLNLKKCEVRADFTGRLKKVSLEKGQFVVSGKSVLTLIDDLILEIKVSIDTIEAGKWLYFKQSKKSDWVKGMKQVPCEIRLTGTQNVNSWDGILHRVVEYDRKTRTVTLAVRTVCNESEPDINGLVSIVDGMFCSVRIQGKTMTNVIRLPRSVLSMENTVYTSVNNHLVTAPVNILRVDGEFVYISDGLKHNDLIVSTRLVNPLENSTLNIMNPI